MKAGRVTTFGSSFWILLGSKRAPRIHIHQRSEISVASQNNSGMFLFNDLGLKQIHLHMLLEVNSSVAILLHVHWQTWKLFKPCLALPFFTFLPFCMYSTLPPFPSSPLQVGELLYKIWWGAENIRRTIRSNQQHRHVSISHIDCSL